MSVDNLTTVTYRAAFMTYAQLGQLIRLNVVRRYLSSFCVRDTPRKPRMQTMRMLALFISLLAIGFANLAQASELTAAFEAACERTPDIPALAARRAEIGAKANAAEALLPGGPWTTLVHRTDALTNDRGTREYEAEFGVPIWLRGERGAMLSAALTEGERIEAEISAKRLEVAKRVRDAYWIVAEAREKLAIAERRRATSDTCHQRHLVEHDTQNYKCSQPRQHVQERRRECDANAFTDVRLPPEKISRERRLAMAGRQRV